MELVTQDLLRSCAINLCMSGTNVLNIENLKETVSDRVAREKIEKFLNALNSSGREKVNILDILFEFKYPPGQIERVMSVLEKEGVVKEGL
jgi:hypothetical protein